MVKILQSLRGRSLLDFPLKRCNGLLSLQISSLPPPPLFLFAVPLSPPAIVPVSPPHSAVSPSLSRLFSFCFVVSLSLLFLPSVLLLFFSCYFSTLFILLCLCPQLFLLSLSVYISELNPSLVVTKPLKSCIANVLNPNAYPTFFLQLRLVIPLRRVCLNSPLSMII